MMYTKKTSTFGEKYVGHPITLALDKKSNLWCSTMEEF